MYMANIIFSNVTDLGRFITKLNERKERYEIKECKGIYGENLINVYYRYVED